MSEICRLKAIDYEDAMDFMNMVFSLNAAPTNFPQMLPKLYQPDDQLMQYNYAIKRNNRIRAVVGSFPLQMHAGRETLKIAGIGGVSTHPGERKSGFMRKLMETAIQDMENDNVDLSVLGGQRQRYGYYGYENGGFVVDYHLTKTNLRHTLRGKDTPAVTFRCVAAAAESKHSPDRIFETSQRLKDTVDWMIKAHAAQTVYLDRSPADFLTILTSWYCSVWTAYEKEMPVGYFVLRPNGSISELITSENGCAQNIIAAWLMQQDADQVVVQVQPSQTDISSQLAQICEYWQINQAYNYRIINWPRVLKAFLQVKADAASLPDGSLDFWFHDINKGCSLSLYKGLAQAKWLDDQKDSCLKLDSLTATRLVTGPLSALQVLTAEQLPDTNERMLLSSWFPLPFGWSMPDGI